MSRRSPAPGDTLRAALVTGEARTSSSRAGRGGVATSSRRKRKPPPSAGVVTRPLTGANSPSAEGALGAPVSPTHAAGALGDKGGVQRSSCPQVGFRSRPVVAGGGHHTCRPVAPYVIVSETLP